MTVQIESHPCRCPLVDAATAAHPQYLPDAGERCWAKDGHGARWKPTDANQGDSTRLARAMRGEYLPLEALPQLGDDPHPPAPYTPRKRTMRRPAMAKLRKMRAGKLIDPTIPRWPVNSPESQEALTGKKWRGKCDPEKERTWRLYEGVWYLREPGQYTRNKYLPLEALPAGGIQARKKMIALPAPPPCPAPELPFAPPALETPVALVWIADAWEAETLITALDGRMKSVLNQTDTDAATRMANALPIMVRMDELKAVSARMKAREGGE